MDDNKLFMAIQFSVIRELLERYLSMAYGTSFSTDTPIEEQREAIKIHAKDIIINAMTRLAKNGSDLQSFIDFWTVTLNEIGEEFKKAKECA